MRWGIANKLDAYHSECKSIFSAKQKSARPTQATLDWYDALSKNKSQIKNCVETPKKMYKRLAAQRQRTIVEQMKFDIIFDPTRQDWRGTDDWWRRDVEKKCR